MNGGPLAPRSGPVPPGGVPVRSTRAPDGPDVPLDDALLRGLAPDGGLYLPTVVPPLPDGWADAPSFADLAAGMLAPWWGDDADAVAPLVRDATAFPVPLVPLGGNRWLVELFHGPTLSFKDVGARTMARLAGRALARRGATATVLVATSGDTGSAVADGFAGIPGVRVALLYPRGRVSDVQERQLVAARPGVRAFAVDGDFDACQRLVKEAFVDPALADAHLTSANSINVGRLLPQATYYAWAVAQLRRAHGVDAAPWVVVPSGNLGNLTGGRIAAAAGVPVAGWLAAHNANAFLPDVLAGRRAKDDRPATVATRANAMDVGAPSNFERLDAWFGEALPRTLHANATDDAATLARMTATYDADGEVVCPHTAVGLEGLARLRAARPELRDAPTLVLATAHPAKFPAAVRDAIGVTPDEPDALARLRDAPRRVEPLAPTLDALRDALLHGAWPDA